MVELKDLSFNYGSGFRSKRQDLFQGVNLSLKPGNIYGLLGLNGAGKSTLLRLMSGLLFPGSGRLDVLGYEPEKRQPSFLSKIFVLPEAVVVPNVTDKEYIAMRAPFYPNFDAEQMARFIVEFEIPTGRKLTTFSHGQQKKFLLSFGLACNPDLLILDEPTNGLDIPSKGIFRRLVAESLTDDQIFIVSTHQVRDIETLVDSVAVLHQGKILFNQNMGEVTDRLRMSLSPTRSENDNGLIYSEQTVGGFASIWKDATAGGGQIDLELLFKAVIANPEQFIGLFSDKLNGEG